MGILNNAVINFATAADQTVITGVSGKQIKVYALECVAAGTTQITPKDGSTGLTGAMSLAVAIPLVLPANPNGDPWFVCGQGNSFVITNGQAIQVSGNCRYEIT